MKRFYANLVTDGEKSLTQLTKQIERSYTVNDADLRAVLYALVEVATDYLCDGTIVRLSN